jgi:hypothetical protein
MEYHQTSNFRPPDLAPASEVWPRKPTFIPAEDTAVYKPAPLADLKSKLTVGCCHKHQTRDNEPRVSTISNPFQPPRPANQGPYLESPVPPFPHKFSNVPHVSPLTPPVESESWLVKTVWNILQVELPMISRPKFQLRMDATAASANKRILA